MIDSSDEDETSSAEESVGSNSPVSEEEERRGRASARGNGSGPNGKNGTAGTEGIIGKGPGMIKSMIKIVGDSGGGGSKKKKKGGGIDARKGTASMRRTSMSLLAAAEEERKAVSAKYSVRSLLPSISITPSSIPGATSPTTNRRSGVHPSTNFDLPSHNSTPISSDTEADVRDLHRAQRMEMSLSPIISTPETQRVVRTILRGEYDSIVREAEESNKRVRSYLVATDLSGEAQHALEWTIGTVLRDGDTLMAIYAIDQDTVEDGGKIVSDDGIAGELSSQAAAVGTSLAAVSMPHTPGTASPLSNFAIGDISERSRERTKAERERYVAAEAITRMVEKLLKKTRLQVRVTVEVIHCKSPKHLLTEIIDYMEPTLVVLGSRGRSALKGVLLGSFSNYLVTKSSVPVMVARKKLKHTKKFAKTNVRQPNNLTSAQTGRLAGAKVD
jgi:nucleotide-binding universal stress UspA family protein